MFKLFWGKVRYFSKVLATITTFDMVGRVRVCGYQEIAQGKGSVSKAASPRVVSAFPLVEFS